MKILASEKLSSHKYKTPEGYLICTDAILARTGKQDYMRRELFGGSCENPDDIIWVDRTADEVFSNETLSSFENKPITVEHPNEDVNPSNYKELAVGYVRDVRRDKMDDGTEVIKGNLVITDEKTIEEILNGEHTDLSCGYDCEILDENNPQQRRIRGNHVALCEEGRAGVARIVDSKLNDENWREIYELIYKKAGINKKDMTLSSSGIEFYEDYDDFDIKMALKAAGYEAIEIKNGHEGRVVTKVKPIKDSKVKDNDEWTIKNTSLAYEVWNGRKFIKEFVTKRQAIEWIQDRFPGDKIIFDSKVKDKGYTLNNKWDNREEFARIAKLYHLKTYGNDTIEGKVDDIEDFIHDYCKETFNKEKLYDSIVDNKIKDMAHFDMSEDDWDEITNNGDDESWIVNHYDISIKREWGRVKVAATGSRKDLEKLYKDYHLRDYGVKIMDAKVKDKKYVYEFPYDSMTSKDKQMMKKYNLTILGKSGKERDEENLAVKGNLKDLEAYCDEYLGYIMHPDYLAKENEFAYDMYDSKTKDSKNIEKIAKIASILNKIK